MRLLPRFAAILLAAVSVTACSATAEDDKLAGHYYLQGASEVGSELVLGKDGKFSWMLSYGASDNAAQGTWQLKGKQVVLSAVAVPMAFRAFTDSELNVVKPVETGTWIAIVGIPDMGPVADVEVKFEAKSGKSAIAMSVSNGDAIVKMPAGEQWSRAGLRRSNSQEAWSWVAVTPERAKARIAGFAIANPQSIQSGFKTLELSVEKGGLALSGPEMGIKGLYVKRP